MTRKKHDNLSRKRPKALKIPARRRMPKKTDDTYGSFAVSRITGVPLRTIKRWEDKGYIPLPARDSRGHRRYIYDDIMIIIGIDKNRKGEKLSESDIRIDKRD